MTESVLYGGQSSTLALIPRVRTCFSADSPRTLIGKSERIAACACVLDLPDFENAQRSRLVNEAGASGSRKAHFDDPIRQDVERGVVRFRHVKPSFPLE